MRELEEKKSKEAFVLVQKKAHFVTMSNERERTRMLPWLGGSRAIRHWTDSRDTISVESCSSSMACEKEEVCSESSRKIKDMDETTSEAVTKGKEKEVWRLELEGEAEKLEAIGLWSEVTP